MAYAEGESLESWLNKATNPSSRQEDWQYVLEFCDQINKELEGPQIALRLLAHKIQSPQEWEAIQALTVLEACMKNCGRRFQNEVGKFRFLNELVKVVLPKYLGDRVSETVKTKVVEILFCWTVALPDDAKISKAYQMLKRQGIVTVDPAVPVDKMFIPSPPSRPRNPVFDDEEKSKRLAELLKSKKPEDLQEANCLIKNMVTEDEARAQKAWKCSSTLEEEKAWKRSSTLEEEKAWKCSSTLEEVNNSLTLMKEMLSHFSREYSTVGDKDFIRELYCDCDKLRQAVFKLATETEDNDSSLGGFLQAFDDLSHVINSYKQIVEGQTVDRATEPLGPSAAQCAKDSQSEILIDLAGLDLQSPISPAYSKGLNDPVPALSNPAVNAAKDDSLNSQRAPLQASSDPVLDLFSSTPLLAPGVPPVLLAASLNATPVRYPQSSGVTASFSFPSTARPVSASLNHSLQDLAMLDLGNSTSLPGVMDTAGLFGMREAMGASSSSSSSSSAGIPPSRSSPLPPSLLRGAGVSSSPSAKFQAVDSPSLPSTSPILPLGLARLPSTSPILPLGLASLPSTSPSLPRGLASLPSTSPSLPLGPASLPSTSPILPLGLASLPSTSPSLPLGLASPARGPEISLANVHVPLRAIKPSKVCPVAAYHKHGLSVLLHFAPDYPPGRPDVLVMVVSMLNTASLPVKSIFLQAAVPKSMKVRLQPASGTELAPFNPMLPPAAITQVMLLANPLMEQVRMRYKMTFTLGEQLYTESGVVDQFPLAERWGGSIAPCPLQP